MTAHVVSFTPAGAPTAAWCSECGLLGSFSTWWFSAAEIVARIRRLAEAHCHDAAKRGEENSIEFAGLPPVERAS